jgi:hypothetical protein
MYCLQINYCVFLQCTVYRRGTSWLFYILSTVIHFDMYWLKFLLFGIVGDFSKSITVVDSLSLIVQLESWFVPMKHFITWPTLGRYTVKSEASLRSCSFELFALASYSRTQLWYTDKFTNSMKYELCMKHSLSRQTGCLPQCTSVPALGLYEGWCS